VSLRISLPWILLLLRVVTGAVLIYFGWPKARNLKSTAGAFAEMGFHPGLLWGTVIAIVEFVGGLAMIAGVYAELAASLFGFQMIVGTFWKLKIGKPFTDYSYDLLLLAVCVAIMALGAGDYALVRFDAQVFLRWDIAVAAILAGALWVTRLRPAASESPSAPV
jgi:putative oxidoreductase